MVTDTTFMALKTQINIAIDRRPENFDFPQKVQRLIYIFDFCQFYSKSENTHSIHNSVNDYEKYSYWKLQNECSLKLWTFPTEIYKKVKSIFFVVKPSVALRGWVWSKMEATNYCIKFSLNLFTSPSFFQLSFFIIYFITYDLLLRRFRDSCKFFLKLFLYQL